MYTPCASTGSWAAPGAGITKSYDCDSESLRIFVTFFSGLAAYNACETILMIFLTFTRFNGSYFWSMLIAGAGIIPYSISSVLDFLSLTSGKVTWVPMVLLSIGWYAMIGGQACVLYSRLHLILTGPQGERLIKLARWMIILNIICLGIPTTVMSYGSNGSINAGRFHSAYNVMEKIQMTGFAVQECLLSLCFVLEAVKMLRTSLRPAPRKVMRQLLVISLAIIVMDIGLVSIEYASLYVMQIVLKGTFYSIKLKLEFVILGKLVKFIGDTKPREGHEVHQDSVGFITTHDISVDLSVMDTHDFVDLDRIAADLTHPSASYRASRRMATDPDMKWEYDIACFEHGKDASSLHGSFSRSLRGCD